ncbi:MAG: RluA family pseudouridine synthase [Actinomycetes bacterium]
MAAVDRRELPVPEGLDGLRLDAAVARLFGLSRAAAADLVAAGAVEIDGVRRERTHRVGVGGMLSVELPRVVPEQVAPPQAVPGLDIVYDDDDVVVVDKPVGVATHPSPGWDGPTVTAGLAAAGYRLSELGPAERGGVVHRLDVGTSGLLVVAKSGRAYRDLKAAFRNRTVDKGYHALVQGHPDPLRGTVDAPIDRHPTAPFRFAVVADGKPSVTHYETLEAVPAASLLAITLETGRTHQIRVHMAALRHPCVGDLTYGADPVLAARLGLTRQWLHAVRLGFDHPADGRRLTFTSDYPSDLGSALDTLRNEAI